MSDTYRKTYTIDLATASTGDISLDNYLHFEIINMQVSYDGVDKTDATLTFEKNDDPTTYAWTVESAITGNLDSITGTGMFNLDYTFFNSSYVGVYLDKGTATVGTITIALTAKMAQEPLCGSGTNPKMVTMATGALVIGDNTITHNLGKTHYIFQLVDTTNQVLVNQTYPDPANPTTKYIINMTVALPTGLTFNLIGY